MDMRLNPKVVVITPGRWHCFDLAEQLEAVGRLAAIYTGYPRFKLKNTSVDAALIRTFPWFTTPSLALAHFTWIPDAVFRSLWWWGTETMGRLAARTLPECGVVCALSGSGREAGREIRRRGGVYVCDRGSTHIVWQQNILRQEYALLGMPWPGVDPRVVGNEQAEYALADVITLPSQFTRRTFLEMGISSEKLRVVPYGVNLASFRRTVPRSDKFRIAFVGALSVRKGLHHLLAAFNLAKLPDSELVLVGGRSPDTAELLRRHHVDDVTLLGHVSREEVARQMSLASVMVLPSLEEGLALVQAQAMACGCPVIATTNTGSEDLFEDGKEGFIVPIRDPEAIAEKLILLYRNRSLIDDMGNACLQRVSTLGGWKTYGRKMLEVFDEQLGRRKT